jgi:peptide/nickel transport system substrate-binding protein
MTRMMRWPASLAALALLIAAAAPVVAAHRAPAIAYSARNTFTMAINSPTYSLDPALMNDVPSEHLDTALYQPLVQYKPGGYTLEPVLATSWSHNANDSEWTFVLRRDVHFTDGTTLTSADVVASVERMIKIGQGSSYLISDVKRVYAAGADKVVFGDCTKGC